MKRVEVQLTLMLDVDKVTEKAVQAAFVSYLGDVSPHQVAEGLVLTGYEEEEEE